MAPIPVIAPTIIRVALHHGLGNGRVGACVLDVSLDDGTVGNRVVDVPTVALKVRDAWQDEICPSAPSSRAFTGGTYLDLDSLSGVGGAFGPNGSKPTGAGSTGAIASPNNALLVHKICGHDRRQRNGRLYLPFIYEPDINDDGTISGTALTSWNTKLDALRTAINGITPPAVDGSIALRVVHIEGHEASTIPGKPGRPNAWSSSDVTDMVIDGRVATQRRRNRG